MYSPKQAKPITKLLGSLAIGLASIAAFAPSAQAAGYCSLNTETGGISEGNVTYEGSAANDCYGTIGGNLNPAGVTAAANGLTWGTGWTYLAKDEGGGGSGSFSGIDFDLSASTFTDNMGTWTLTATDTNGGAPLNLPTSLDFIVTLKGGSGDTSLAFWFFDNVQVNAGDNDGTFEIVFLNPGGNTPNLSHMDLLVREGTVTCPPTDPVCNPQEVPEPGGLSLLGLGLAGLAVFRRRRVV